MPNIEAGILIENRLLRLGGKRSGDDPQNLPIFWSVYLMGKYASADEDESAENNKDYKYLIAVPA